MRQLLLAALLPCAALAQPLPPKPAKAQASGSNFKISFKIRSAQLESAGNFVVQDGEQANYTRGGERPYEIETARGTGIEFKKHATIVSCLPSWDASGPNRVRLSCQFELSGALPATGKLSARPIETFQLQTSFILVPGKPLVLVDDDGRYLEVGVVELKP